MREDVCIVLNEREPSKARAAEAIQSKLQEKNIAASRPEIDKDIEEVLVTRLPRVLLLDYLIGDYSTGLDIMRAFEKCAPERRPQFIFLTDEPSLAVAVEAMRSGAANYFELDNPRAVELATQNILDLLPSAGPVPPAAGAPRPSLDGLIGNAPASRRLIEDARLLVLKHAPIILICGPAGSGCSTLAQALALEKFKSTYCAELDLHTFDGSFPGYFGISPEAEGRLRLGRDLSAVIEHVEEDTGDLLEFLGENHKRIWPAGSKNCSGGLISCTNSRQLARLWQKTLSAAVLQVPALDERREDIPALVQRFLAEAEEVLGKTIKLPDADTITWLSNLSWPGHLKQLHAQVVDAALRSALGKEKLRDLLNHAREIWDLEQSSDAQPDPIDPFLAAVVLEASRHNFRIAAARLGCSQSVLNQTLTGVCTNAQLLDKEEGR